MTIESLIDDDGNAKQIRDVKGSMRVLVGCSNVDNGFDVENECDPAS